MSTPARTQGRRLKSFRLGDVSEEARLRALDKLLKTKGSSDGMLVASWTFTDRLALGLAARQPSDRVYWVSQEAWERVTKGRG